MMFRKFATLVLCGLAFSTLHAEGVDSDDLSEFGKGIITDYSNMAETDRIEWVWVAPGVRLSQHGFRTSPVENLTAMADAGMEDAFNANLERALQRIGARNPGAPKLDVKSAVYWANRASSGKRWIPYVGGHLAQAGVGIELVFTNAQGDVVAKVRHSGREGDELQHAAEELVDDLRAFVEAS